jgi:hypothetical protein
MVNCKEESKGNTGNEWFRTRIPNGNKLYQRTLGKNYQSNFYNIRKNLRKWC